MAMFKRTASILVAIAFLLTVPLYARKRIVDADACSDYINERWTAAQEAKAINTNQAWLAWKYDRKYSRKCRKILFDDILIEKAERLELISKKISEYKWNGFIQDFSKHASNAAKPHSSSSGEFITLRDYQGDPVSVKVSCTGTSGSSITIADYQGDAHTLYFPCIIEGP